MFFGPLCRRRATYGMSCDDIWHVDPLHNYRKKPSGKEILQFAESATCSTESARLLFTKPLIALDSVPQNIKMLNLSLPLELLFPLFRATLFFLHVRRKAAQALRPVKGRSA